MPTFCEYFAIQHSQAEVDFVDIDLETDTPLYICPYAIEIRNDDWSAQCGDLIRSFFTEVLAQLRAGSNAHVSHLLSHLHEPNETRLGESRDRPQGRGVGTNKSFLLGESLRNSRAYHTGLLNDIAETELFIFGVGRDTISDLTTNIIRGPLAEYALAQCELHGVPVRDVRTMGPSWNPTTRNWEATTFRLPVHLDRPILLVPKASVRFRMSIDSQEFYNFHMVEFLQAEYLRAGSALVHTFKNGRRTVYKSAVKEVHPFIKDDLAEFVRQHPEVLERYKELSGAKGPLENSQLDEDLREELVAEALIDRLELTPGGTQNATNYHNLALGIATFLFYPNLIKSIKEFEQHDGRKRVDIVYTNAATAGFFHRRLSAPQTRAVSVFVECKNYTREIANPELDQLSGRFSVRRGSFGILMCRSMDNRDRILDGCRDTALDGRGYMLPLEDSDLVRLLEYVKSGRRPAIDHYLEQLFDRVSR